jgi:hypothetical protein
MVHRLMNRALYRLTGALAPTEHAAAVRALAALLDRVAERIRDRVPRRRLVGDGPRRRR